jgi:hypothetical protein
MVILEFLAKEFHDNEVPDCSESRDRPESDHTGGTEPHCYSDGIQFTDK